VPRGRLDTERPLVDYRRKTGSSTAAFRVSLVDLPATADLAAHLAAPSLGVARWAQAGPPRQVSVGGATGTRYRFTGRVGEEETEKEGVCVRRGERGFFFTALYAPTATP